MRKTNELLVSETHDFAQKYYESKQTVFGELFFDHALHVAAQAEKMAIKLYSDLRADYFAESVKDNVSAVVHCAMLHDILNVSACAFEQVAEATNVQIAAMVADISRDYRLIETKRDAEYRGRVSQSPLGAQIVVVADAICTTQTMLRCFDKTGLGLVPRLKKTISQLDGDLLSVQSANKYYVLRMYCHAAKNMLIDVSQKIKDRKHKAKLAKYVAQQTKSLRERVDASAEKKEPQSRAKGQKAKPAKKEVKYARKQKRT
jgi:(p)ppGpp synthase/HD superfamily hydrolase